jgi:hypothetical protein
MRQRGRGVLLALAAALLFGLSTPAAKAPAGTLDPWLLAGLLYLGSGLGLGAFWLARPLLGRWSGEAALARGMVPGEAQAHDHRHTHDEHHQHGHDGDAGPVPHVHGHVHAPLRHSHPHYPDPHHRHSH